MPVPAATGPGDQSAFLIQARKLYVASRFKASLIHFKMALLKCNCNRDLVVTAKKLGISLKEISIPTCHCKDLNALSLTPNPDKLAMYNLASKPCTCGSGLVACKLPAHLGAIEGIAAAYDKLGIQEKAYQYASLYVIMAPNAPEGYLRMAKALRLMENSQSSDITTRCTWIYHQALESVRTYGNKNHEKLKILHSLLRKDIIGSLPTELQIMVLKNLSHVDICRCMRVNKAWNRVSRNSSLWKDLKFVRYWRGITPRPLRPGVLDDIISKRASNRAKTLSICGMRDFGIDIVKIGSILKALPQLESFKVTGSDSPSINRGQSFKDVLQALFREVPPSLQILHLGSFLDGNSAGWSFRRDAPLPCNLQELVISNLSSPLRFLVPDVMIPGAWPKLEKLMISGYGRSSIDVLLLLTAMPALRDVSLLQCVLDSDQRSDAIAGSTQATPVPTWASWDNLERFVLEEAQWRLRGLRWPAYMPRLPPDLRSLEVPATQMLHCYKFMATNFERANGEPPHLGLERLEHLRLSEYEFMYHDDERYLSFMENLSWFLELLAPSMSNGTLKSLDIPYDSILLSEFGLVLDKQAIRTISCNTFPPTTISSQLTRGGDCHNLCVWLDQFPNLNTVGVFTSDVEGCMSIVSELLSKKNNIHTIYTKMLRGVHWDDALRAAEERGIRLIHADRVPEPVLEPLIKE
ncbi:F-box/LRR-repeat protein 5 [Cytospora mali]|uniref:F-box/LRR-repeat protein 5 n=1 Tax=Cytospora mali TaxID=578113 RepID=A0A194V3F5_CYTMA|nr:F-box/LRR-repeat protein 5 [Valsa mali var. pyri (nom. inval.)]